MYLTTEKKQEIFEKQTTLTFEIISTGNSPDVMTFYYEYMAFNHNPVINKKL